MNLKQFFVWMGLLAAIAVGFGWGQLPAKSQLSHVASGTGGAIASENPLATQIGIEVLREGGNAVDAAVAVASALGVVEPFSEGIGGGGFMVIYQPDRDSVVTLDGREKAPAATTPDLFRDPAGNGDDPLAFSPDRMSSGLAVGVPGTPLNWVTALERYGTKPLAELLQPAIALAEDGFIVDDSFEEAIRLNRDRFATFTSTKELYLPGGKIPETGSRFRNPDLAKTYRILADRGVNAFYRGELAEAIVNTVQHPPTIDDPPFAVWPGGMTESDLDLYEVRVRPAVANRYRGYRLFGMGLPSSGGITIAQTLNLLELTDLGTLERVDAMHRIIEAERLAYADRNAYLGDPEYVDVPLSGLLSAEYADERSSDLPAKVPEAEAEYIAVAGNPLLYQRDPSPSLTASPNNSPSVDREGTSTTHLTVVDGRGMVVSYTLTIETTGGSGIVVPGYGFILNNELTDFNVSVPHPNIPEPGKRPRSSMAPTIMLAPDGTVVAFGSPGGASIITTVLGITTNLVDFGMDLPAAIAAPRLSQRNSGVTMVDGGFELTELGQELAASGHQLQPIAEMGAATGIWLEPDGTVLAVAEPQRRGGGSAMTVR